MDNEPKIGDIEVIEGEKLKFGADREGLSSRKKRESSSVMVAFVLKLSHGLIKNEFQANIVLVAVSIVFIVISFFFFF